MTATASAKMPLTVFLRVHRAARIESGRTGEPLQKVYARWLIAGAGLGKRGAQVKT
jgi:IS5 family transposase